MYGDIKYLAVFYSLDTRIATMI